jgi:hypothetical protein
MFPNPKFSYIPSDVIDPKTNGGRTSLYYAGRTRLAKNPVEARRLRIRQKLAPGELYLG